MTYPTLQSLLTESRSTGRMNLVDALVWLQENAPKQLARFIRSLDQIETAIYRGYQVVPSACRLVDPTTSVRSSTEAMDIYRVLLDEANPDWPKRGNSVIGTTNAEYAESFGAVYHVIAPDNANVGCIGHEDLWATNIQRISDALHLVPHAVADVVSGEPGPAYDKVRETLVAAVAPMNRARGVTLDEWRKLLNDLRGVVVEIVTSHADGDVTVSDVADAINLHDNSGGRPQRVAMRITNAVRAWVVGDVDLIDALLPICDYSTLSSSASLQKAGDMSPDDGDTGEVWVGDVCLVVGPEELRKIVDLATGRNEE